MKIINLRGSDSYKLKESNKNNSNNNTNPVQNNNLNYFKTINTIANTNRDSIQLNNNIAFKGYRYTFDKDKITSSDIPENCTHIQCRDIILTGSRNFEEISTEQKAKFWDVIEGDVSLHDSVYVKHILTTGSASLRNNTKADHILARCGIRIADNAKAGTITNIGTLCDYNVSIGGHGVVDTVNSSENTNTWVSNYGKVRVINAKDKVYTNNNSKVEYVSTPQLNIYDNSEIKDVNCNKLFMHGNSKINGVLKLSSEDPNKKFDEIAKISLKDGFPYVNPFLIETNTKDFHPNKLLCGEDYYERNKHLYMPETVYFDSDYSFIRDYKAKNVESKASLIFVDQSGADNVKSLGKVVVEDKANINSIDAEAIFINNNSHVNNITATECVQLTKNATVDNIKSSGEVILFHNSQADNITSEGNINLKGTGTVGNIQCKGNKVTITGPIILKGKIKFEKGGTVYVTDNKFIQPDNVENGNIKYLLTTNEGDTLINHKQLFNNSLTAILSNIGQPDLKQILGIYAGINSLKKFYDNKNPKLAKKLDELCSNDENKAKVEYLYNNFAENSLINLKDNSKDYTVFWARSKKIGKKNLVDFWLQSKGINIKGQNYANKAKMLNELSQEQKNELIGVTVDYWVENILPVQLDKINRNDLKYMELDKTGLNFVEEIKQSKSTKQNKEADQTEKNNWVSKFLSKFKVSETIEEIRQDRKNSLNQIIEVDGIEKFESVQVGTKTLIDFWIDVIDGECSYQRYSKEQKKDRLIEIIRSDEDIDKIYNATLKESDMISNQIKSAQSAYSNLINRAELDEASKDILQEYQNNQLFFLIVNGQTKNKNSIVHLENSTKEILDNLGSERNVITTKIRKNIFEPLKDINYMAQNSDKINEEGQVPIIFSILNDRINVSLPKESDQIKEDIKCFKYIVDTNGEDIDLQWKKLVNTAQKHFEEVQLSRITDSQIKQIYSTQKLLEKPLPDGDIKKSLEDKTFSIEQKDFITRYKDDKNLVTLLGKDANKHREDLDHLIILEQINNSTFDIVSYNFRKNLSPETINNMSEIADMYLKMLGMDSTKMSDQQKYKFLSNVSNEELELANKAVKKYWSKNILTKVMSDNILDKVRNFDAGYQSAQIAQKLDNISIQIDQQHCTLLEMSQNIDHFVDTYKVTQTETNTELHNIAKKLEDIHYDTSNIKTNVKAFLFQSIQSTKDPVMRAEMQTLLQDADRMELSEFVKTVDAKQKQYNKDHKKERLYVFLKEKALGPLVTVGISAGIVLAAPYLATGLAALGLANAGAAITAFSSVVGSATVAGGMAASLM